MQGSSIPRSGSRIAGSLACLMLFLSCPQHSRAWGRNGHRLVVNKAIDTLPQDIRPFFESNLALLSQHVTDPLDTIAKSPTEKHNHFILLDKYGRFPFDALPRNYKAALTKFGKPKLDANGLLPWQIGVYSEKLTEAMKAGKWDEARLNAAILANYVAAARNCHTELSRMTSSLILPARIASLPKAELHLHLEGSIQPATVCALTARHGVVMAEEEVRQRYAYHDFSEFIEAFKWVTTFLRDPEDSALTALGLTRHWLTQNAFYP